MMEGLDLYSLTGEKTGSVTVPTEMVDFEPNETAVYYARHGYQANQVQHTANTKTRAEIRGGGKKPWRQKGTGRARSGTATSPVWRGGGVVFGPRATEHSHKVNKKVRKNAIKTLLFQKIQEKKLVVLESLADAEEQRITRTQRISGLRKALALNGSVLLPPAEMDEVLWKSARNIQKVSVRTVKQLNVFELCASDYIITTKKCLESIKEIF